MRCHDLTALLGRRCQLMVDCSVCGGSHVHEGTVTLARQPGEIDVDGARYPLRDVRAVLALPEGESRTISRAMFDLVLLGGFALAAFSALRAWL
jgi:hypothetical protein